MRAHQIGLTIPWSPTTPTQQVTIKVMIIWTQIVFLSLFQTLMTLKVTLRIWRGALYSLTLAEDEERPRWCIHTYSFIGEMQVDYYLDGHPDVIFDKVQMDADAFIGLKGLLEGRGLLHSTLNMSVGAQLFIFLSIIAHAYSIRDLADHWQRSNETISRCFDNVLEVICTLKDEFIWPPDYNEMQQLLHANPHKYLPWFVVSPYFYACVLLL